MILKTGKARRCRSMGGFTLTEMLVTMLIMVLASTLLATGIPVAIDTYHKVVNSSNAQVALTTTATVLKSELGTSADVRIPSGSNNVVYYLTGEGSWAAIGNSAEFGGSHRGLVKQLYAGQPSSSDPTSVDGLKPVEGGLYPLVSDAAVSEPLHVSFDAVASSGKQLVFSNLHVRDEGTGGSGPNTLANMGGDDYSILIRFAK